MLPSTPAYWDGERWVVQSATALTSEQLWRIAGYLLPVQRARRLGLKPGDRRDDLDRAIAALEAGKIVCGVTMTRNGAEPFKATQGTGRIMVGA
jgi:hypothetical protein